MTGDHLSARSNATSGELGRDASPSVAADILHRVNGSGRDATPEEVMSGVTDALFDDDPVADLDVSEELVTQGLDEILIALIALRDDETHGTGLMEDVATLFDVEPSPGTVYPRLHDLEDKGTLMRHDLVRTKQYSISDDAAARATIEQAMYQHLAVGLFLHTALDAV